MFARAAVIVSLAASTLATVYVTAPIAGTTCSGGSTCNIAWKDDGTTPALGDFGNSMVSVYVGNQQQQTLLQNITGSVNVATTSAITFTVDPTIGPNSGVYFIRFESLTSTTGGAPTEAFSAKFTLNNMSGTFSPAAQAQIDAASSSGSPAPSSGSSSSSASSSAASTTAKTSSTGTSSGSASTSSSSSAAGRNGVAAGALSAVGVVAALFSFAL
ncbi:hypothetical protein M0805_000239 [Coniferiporia weirii]|nr:hypothetical protein M0805_000239 [Coniferiporia weirii]